MEVYYTILKNIHSGNLRQTPKGQSALPQAPMLNHNQIKFNIQ